jgi:hypothetical protein
MNMQPITTECPCIYEENFVFFFISVPRMDVLERPPNYQYMALSQEGVYKTRRRFKVASKKAVCLVTIFYICLESTTHRERDCASE